jgi:hypothetical protein
MEWVLVLSLLGHTGTKTEIDYQVIDYYKSKQDCNLVRIHQRETVNTKYICLPRDRG